MYTQENLEGKTNEQLSKILLLMGQPIHGEKVELINRILLSSHKAQSSMPSSAAVGTEKGGAVTLYTEGSGRLEQQQLLQLQTTSSPEQLPAFEDVARLDVPAIRRMTGPNDVSTSDTEL
ncbi:hypothetical protein BV898_05206 [Hypsibius exemplaris]|uniref:SAP domain-containing protein n=1 Tax=Hypsibius exemplaris TaxID=2072580 RepID=A0A1W0X063_HYPEX|nr:hypothetical protein BV898_05206 [Hypsibius exemplaris]